MSKMLVFVLYFVNNNKKGLVEMKTTTVHKSKIFELNDYTFKVLKKSTNQKLGKKVTKGIFDNHYIFTLTLTERETCPKDCFHWETCYGNNMWRAHRISHKNQNLLQKRIQDDIIALNGKKALIRLHVLGDFFNVDYVKFWKFMLLMFPNIAIFGYTANNTKSKIKLSREIATEIKKLTARFKERFAIRFSNDNEDLFSANSYDVEKPQKGISIVCPEQEGKTETCGTCGFCWTGKQRVLFKTH